MIAFHKKNNYQATLTATRPPGRYGALKLGLNDKVESFQEKPDGDGSWINGGFFIIEPKFLKFISSKKCVHERVYRHNPQSQFVNIKSQIPNLNLTLNLY